MRHRRRLGRGGSLVLLGGYPAHDDASCATAAPWRHYWSEALAAETMAPPGMPAFVLRGVGETVPDSMQLNLTALLEMLRQPRSF